MHESKKQHTLHNELFLLRFHYTFMNQPHHLETNNYLLT